MSGPLEFEEYVELIEKLLNETPEKLLRLAWTVFDFDEDKSLDELDMYSIMRTYEDDEEVFVNAFSYDLCTIAEELKKKQSAAGISDSYIHDAMVSLERKL